MTRRPSRAGFWLIELLFVIGLLGIIAIVAQRLFVTTIRVGQDAAESQNRAATLDSLSAALRSDMWGATKLDVTESKTATLHTSDDREIVWSVEEDAITRREKNGPPQRWSIPSQTTLSSDGGILVLRLASSKSSAAGEARFAGQVQLIGRLAP